MSAEIGMNDIRELSIAELDDVSGAAAPLIAAAIGIGVGVLAGVLTSPGRLDMAGMAAQAQQILDGM